MKRHCLHTDGTVTTNESGGSTRKHCCDCGKVFNISFTYKSVREPGHGSHHMMNKIVYNDWPTEDCPNRPE